MYECVTIYPSYCWKKSMVSNVLFLWNNEYFLVFLEWLSHILDSNHKKKNMLLTNQSTFTNTYITGTKFLKIIPLQWGTLEFSTVFNTSENCWSNGIKLSSVLLTGAAQAENHALSSSLGGKVLGVCRDACLYWVALNCLQGDYSNLHFLQCSREADCYWTKDYQIYFSPKQENLRNRWEGLMDETLVCHVDRK